MRAPDKMVDIGSRFLDAALRPELWQKVLAQLCTEFGAVACDLHLLNNGHPMGNYMGASLRMDAHDPSLHEYVERFLGKEPRSLALSRAESGTVFTDLMIVDSSTMRRHEYYADFLPRRGLGQCIAAVPAVTDTHRAYLGIHFDVNQGSPRDELLRQVPTLLPVLGRACRVAFRLAEHRDQSSLALAVLNTLPFPVLVVDRKCRVLLANAAAEELLCAGHISTYGGCLVSTSTDFDLGLANLVRSAATRTGQCGGVFRLDTPTETWSINVLPTSKLWPDGFAHSALLLFTGLRGQIRENRVASLVSLYGLTRAEAKICVALVNGNSLRDAAAECHMAYNTARVVLNRAFQKVGVGQQSALVAVLGRALFNMPAKGDSSV